MNRAQAQDCPLGKTCYYLPPIMTPPPLSSQGYTEAVIMSAPTQVANYTLQYSSGSPAASSGTVSVGAAPQVTVYPYNMISAFNTAEQKGMMITSDVPDLIVEQRSPATYWQSSSTIRPHTMALGTRFRLAGYNLNQASGGDNTGYDFVSLYAPQGATITVTPPTSAPSSFWSGQATKTVSVTLTAGQTYMLRTLTGIDIDATLVTSTAPISVVVGGRGWGCGSSGDEGADQAMPTSLYGQEFVVRRYPAPYLQDIRIVADTDSTAISVNGVVQTTINAGASYTISQNTGVIYLTADKPVGVFQNAGSTYCENDLAFIPPVAFSNAGASTLGFRTIGTGYGFVVAPTSTISTLRLDDAVVAGSPTTVTGRADLSTINISLSTGTHTLYVGSDFQFGMVSDTGGTGMFAYYNPWRIAGCGDATRTGTEACDDGNVTDGDGCSSVCGVEPGYACSGDVGAQSSCYCAADLVCTTGKYCASGASTNACATKLSNGSTLPDGHGTCGGAAGTLGSAATACASGVCNATAGTCAAANAGSCSSANECVANICGSNSQCGGVSGEDSCTLGSQCQSGYCSASGTCVPSASGCWADTDCTSDKYCHRTTYTCTTKLAAGVTLPADVVHTSCGAGSTNGACQSGRCNPSAGTCALANGGSCGANNECAGNRCGSNGVCGGVTGEDSCLPASQAADCQSGYCSSSGKCVATSGGCWVDSDCTTGNYCFRSTSVCTPQQTPGTSLPADTLHTTCVSGMSAACDSGLCNATASTCASANGATGCTSDGQCVNNICGSNGTCGGVSGEDSCTVATQAADCQSGFCSSSSGTCVGGNSGCWTDADCATDKFCHRATYSCQTKLVNGASLPADTLHNTCGGGQNNAACESGRCNPTAGTCAGTNTNTTCTLAAECITNRCGSNGSCGGASGTDVCTVATQAADCQSGYCSATAMRCVNGATGCWVDADCASGAEYCHRSSYTCTAKLAQGTTLPADSLHDNCGVGSSNAACQSGSCNATTGTCARANGSSCSVDNQCVNNHCGGNGNCGGVNGQDTCTPGTEASDCQSGHCSAQSGTCVSGASGCWADADCDSDEYCHRSSYTCTTKLTPGTPLPQDTLHMSCSAGSNAACATGQCNMTTGTCAGSNSSTSCSSGAQCASNLCGSNGQCGGVSGEDSCFVASQATDCQSGQCSLISGVCVEGAFGCWEDADCSGSQFCHRATFTCEGKRPNGESLPQDSLHASCGTGETNSACDSGRCNPIVSTCAGPNTTTACTDADECVTNRCGTGGHCGGSSGQDSCTVATQATDCQSGVCSPTAMTCVEGASGCWVDADCGSTEYCHRANFMCKPKLAPGEALPQQDTLHDSCSGKFNPACQTEQCNTFSSTCAGPNATTDCLLAAECTNNRCGSNGHCGGVNGEDMCMAESAGADCQSGHCSASSGKCVAVEGGCWVDADCASDKFCHRATFTCTTKLAPGTSLPQDGLHASCGTGETNVACGSGRCNPASSTCAVMSGSACSGGSQCILGSCGSDQRCGLTPGEHCSAASACRSGICGVSAVCLPVGGCDRDTSCGQGSYCDLESLTCKAKLGPGGVIPGDHGTCGIVAGDVGDSLTTCASGVCNRTSNTCALPNGMGPCTSAAQCGTNVCGEDGKCGRAEGSGPCTAGNASDVCRSGACSVSGVCIPMAAGGCWVDADCGAGKYCDRGALACQDKLAAGEPLPDDGLHAICDGRRVSSACALGLCNPDSNTCAGPNLTPCTNDTQCAWNACDPSDGRCGFALGGACDADNAVEVCRSGVCQPSGECLSAGPCKKDADCADGDHCGASLTCAADLPNGRPIPAGRGVCGGAAGSLGLAVNACQSGACNPVSNTCASGLGGACVGSTECTGDSCGADNMCGFTPGQGPCTPQTAASVCRTGTCSASGSVCIPSEARSCWNDDECGVTEFCKRDTFTCAAKLARGAHLPTDGLHDTCPGATHVSAACTSGRCNSNTNTCAEDNGATCAGAQDCIANMCDPDGKCGLPLASGPCTSSNATSVCRSRTCSKSGVCILSNGCTNDADCAQGRYCESSNMTCVPLLLPGTAIPADREACTADSTASSPANRACAGHRCNPTTNTCAGENDTLACTAASECATNVCGSDGRCGRASGSGPCSVDNAGSVCRSGHCAAHSGVCIPDADSCWLDEDCGDARFCDRSSLQCKAAFYSGQALPVDGTHDTCPTNGMNAACLSGRCNAQSDTCASENKIECTAPSECSTNLCGENGQCGLADGEIGCDLVSGATLCQSGMCTDAGACGSEGAVESGCKSDADCSGEQYCEVATKQCQRRPNVRLSGGGGFCSVSAVGSGQTSTALLLLACLAALGVGRRSRRTTVRSSRRRRLM